MRKLIGVMTLLAALAVAGPAGAATKSVNIFASGFSPKSITITEGDTVTWTNRDSTANHQVLASRGEFVSPILHRGNSYSFTFKAAGSFSYSDELHPKLTGTIVVKGLPPSVTMGVSAPIITAGTKVTISGVVSTHKAGEAVAIYYRPYPQPNLIQRATILTSDGGNFSMIVAPGILTTYEAAWKGAFSTPATIQVMPSLSLGRNNGWIVHASAAHSFAGRSVQIQRLNLLTGQWVTLRKVQLSSKSSARVTLTLPKGLNRLRVTMSVNQAGAGYLGVIGPTILWRQT
jgi:plastocyanin